MAGYTKEAREHAAIARKIRNRLGEAAYQQYKRTGIVPFIPELPGPDRKRGGILGGFHLPGLPEEHGADIDRILSKVTPQSKAYLTQSTSLEDFSARLLHLANHTNGDERDDYIAALGRTRESKIAPFSDAKVATPGRGLFSTKGLATSDVPRFQQAVMNALRMRSGDKREAVLNYRDELSSADTIEDLMKGIKNLHAKAQPDEKKQLNDIHDFLRERATIGKPAAPRKTTTPARLITDGDESKLDEHTDKAFLALADLEPGQMDPEFERRAAVSGLDPVDYKKKVMFDLTDRLVGDKDFEHLRDNYKDFFHARDGEWSPDPDENFVATLIRKWSESSSDEHAPALALEHLQSLRQSPCRS